MKISIKLVAGSLLCCGLVGSLRVQSQALPTLPRLSQTIDDTSLVTLENTTDMRILTAEDDGRVSPDVPMERITLVLKSSPEQEAALEQLLSDQQDPSSQNYQQWLTPEEFGERFGASSQELDAVVGWLTEHGFTVDNIANSRRAIEFNGTASQVEGAFHTEIHWYESDGEAHIANATDISIPMALTPVVGGVVGLNDFRAQSMMTRADGNHGMSPRDFATIYNVTSLWNQGFDGKGQSIAIVAQSNIKLSDITNFRAQFGLPPNDPQIMIVPGSDPGITGDEAEADLDVEWAGAIAKRATIKLVVAKSAGLSALYIVDNNVAPIISVSFGLCESVIGSSGLQAFGSLWQQAAAQGMSVFVASGDSGSALCDNPNSSSKAQRGLAVNGLASTPYNVAVGGTRFNESGSYATYWNSTNNIFSLSSARGHVPEVVWNDNLGLWSSGGGVSLFWPKPSWQVGLGVPAADPYPGTTSGHSRYLPDISLSASGHDGYVVRIEGHLYFAAGTSASTPTFAGIMAMINQMTGQTNGNPNPRLYAIANQSPSIFHDVTTGSNAVPCVPGSPNCLNGLTSGYPATPSYDLATGWGSVDAYALAHAWKP